MSARVEWQDGVVFPRWKRRHGIVKVVEECVCVNVT